VEAFDPVSYPYTEPIVVVYPVPPIEVDHADRGNKKGILTSRANSSI
jgi:hypothetical protein